jgi:hypothetical protein
MARTRKLESPVTLFAAIEREQHEALRAIAFAQRRSIADIARDALTEYIERHGAGRSPKSREARLVSHRS